MDGGKFEYALLLCVPFLLQSKIKKRFDSFYQTYVWEQKKVIDYSHMDSFFKYN